MVSRRAITASSIKYSRHAPHCKTGSCFKMTIRSSEKAEPRHDPSEAVQAVRLLVEPPSAIAGGLRLPPKPRPFRFIPNRHRAAIRGSAMLDFLCLLYS